MYVCIYVYMVLHSYLHRGMEQSTGTDKKESNLKIVRYERGSGKDPQEGQVDENKEGK